MGYYRDYYLQVRNRTDDAPDDLEVLWSIKKFLKNPIDSFADNLYMKTDNLSCYEGQEEEVRWYNHEQDMKRLSKEFPNEVFTLGGEGRDREDMWEKDFKNGVMRVRRIQILPIPEYTKF